MAKKKTEVQLKFEANTSEFNTSIKNMNSDINLLNNQLKLNSTQLKGNSNDINLLTERQNLLTIELQKSTQKVDDTSSKLAEAKKLFGDNSQEVRNLTNDLLKAQNQEQAIKNELSGVNTQVEKVTTSVGKLDDACDNADDGFTIMKGTLADLTSNAIQGIVGGVTDLIGSFLDLSEATEEYRSMNAKLEGSATSWGYSIDFANEKYKELYSYLGDSQMSTNAITNLMGLGLETDKVSSLVEGAIGVWASYGDSIPIESLTESINETIQVGKVTGTFADTINWAKVSNADFTRALGEGSSAQKAFNKALADGEATEDAFSAALAATSDTQERANIVANFLNNTYGESKNTYNSMTSGIRDANTAEVELMDVQSEMANALDPVNNAFTSLKTDALEAMLPIVESVSSAFLDLKDYLEENEGVATILKGVVIGLAAGFGVLAVALAIQGLIKGVTTAFALLNATIAANPIVLIIAAISALVAGFIYLWNNCESFRNFWIGLWDGVTSFFISAKDTIIGGFNSVVDFAKNNWQGILLFIVNPFAGAFKLLYDNCDGFRNKVDDLKNKVVGTFSGIANTLKNIFRFNIDLPKMKMPHFSINPRGWQIGDLMKGKIPKLAVNWYAKGGVFTKPTIFNTANGSKGVAEAGSEAVLPLNVLDDKIKNSMSYILENYDLNTNALGLDNIVNANVSDGIITSMLNKTYLMLEKIANKDWSLYVDSTELATATSNASDEISGEMIELKDRGLEI